jgi:hypothetical protein
MKKQELELWVQRTLSHTTDSRKVAEQIVVASLIDDAVSLCKMGQWNAWTGWALASDPTWQKQMPEQISKFRGKVVAAIWPNGFEELKRATITLSIFLHQAAEVFLEHSKKQDDTLHSIRFYQNDGQFNPHYDEDLARYNEWIDRCHEKLRDATKAANWFGEIVRRDVNPMFFAIEGKFLITEGPFMDASFRTRLLEFTEKEKANFPAIFLDQMKKDKTKGERAPGKQKLLPRGKTKPQENKTGRQR